LHISAIPQEGDRHICLSSPVLPEPPNSEADTLIIARKLESRYAPVRIDHRPNRPHISSDIYQCQRARRQNQPASPQSLGARLPTVSPKFPSPSVSCDPFRRPVAVCAASVRRYLRITPGSRKCLFRKTVTFLERTHQTTEIATLSTPPQMHPIHPEPPQGRILRKSPTPAKPPEDHAPRAANQTNRVTSETYGIE